MKQPKAKHNYNRHTKAIITRLTGNRNGRKSKDIAYAYWFFLGLFSIHRFYIGKTITGVIYLLTGQLFFIGWVVDLFILGDMVEDYNNKKAEKAP